MSAFVLLWYLPMVKALRATEGITLACLSLEGLPVPAPHPEALEQSLDAPPSWGFWGFPTRQPYPGPAISIDSPNFGSQGAWLSVSVFSSDSLYFPHLSLDINRGPNMLFRL